MEPRFVQDTLPCANLECIGFGLSKSMLASMHEQQEMYFGDTLLFLFIKCTNK